MHVLLSNDDGIFAPGICTLADALTAAGHRVTVYAPDGQRSVAGRSMTIHDPLTLNRVEMNGLEAYAVSGTPVDCVRLALYRMRGSWPDFVVCGINQGQNRGAATGYSGTVGAALEGAMYGIQGLAVSLCSFTSQDFDTAAKIAVQTLDWATRHPLPRAEIYSLNVPTGAVRGVRAATLSNEFVYKLNFRPLPDGRYEPLWDDTVLPETDENSDLNLTGAGYAALSVLRDSMLSPDRVPDMSDYPNTLAHTGMEIERKYLIRMPDEEKLRRMPGCEIWDIVQTYLADGVQGETRRVRQIETAEGTKYMFTCKRHISALSHEEHERELTRAEYEELLRDANPKLRPIRKRRLRIPYEGHLLEIDIYDFWNDRATLEAEMEREDEEVRLPPWLKIVREVTGERAYKNRHLAKTIPMEEI